MTEEYSTLQKKYYKNRKDIRETYIGSLTLIYFVVVLIVWSLIVLISPESFHSGQNGLDRGKVFAASLLLSLFIIILFIITFFYLS